MHINWTIIWLAVVHVHQMSTVKQNYLTCLEALKHVTHKHTHILKTCKYFDFPMILQSKDTSGQAIAPTSNPLRRLNFLHQISMSSTSQI